MEYAIVLSGAITGWIFIEALIAGAFGKKCPGAFNVGMAFVGAVIAYASFVK